MSFRLADDFICFANSLGHQLVTSSRFQSQYVSSPVALNTWHTVRVLAIAVVMHLLCLACEAHEL